MPSQPGDVLEIEFIDITPEPTAFSCIIPGLGFLRDVMTEPFLVQWTIKDGWATSAQIPGVRIPGAPFMGVSAVAPSAEKLKEWTAREQRLMERGGMVFPPDPVGAVPGGARLRDGSRQPRSRCSASASSSRRCCGPRVARNRPWPTIPTAQRPTGAA